MSKALRAEMPAISIFDPAKEDAFSAEIRRTVDEITGGNYDIESMSQAQKDQLRQKLLGVSIVLTKDGEIIHE